MIGDSHADQLDEVIAQQGQAFGQPVYLTVRNCIVGQYGLQDFCSSDVLDRVISEARKYKVRNIVSISTWHPKTGREWVFKENNARLMNAGFTVWHMVTVPSHAEFDPMERAKALLSDKVPSVGDLPTKLHRSKNLGLRKFFAGLAVMHPRQVKILDPESLLCDEDACDFHTNGYPNYSDTHHLTSVGAQRIKGLFRQVFELPR